MYNPQQIEQAKKKLVSVINHDERNELYFIAYGRKREFFVRGNSIASFLHRKDVPCKVYIGRSGEQIVDSCGDKEKKLVDFSGLLFHEDYTMNWEVKLENGSLFFEERDFISGTEVWNEYKLTEIFIFLHRYVTDRQRITHNWSLTSSCL